MSKRCYYEILGVERTVTTKELKKTYRSLALKYHPDKNPGDADAEAMFKEVSEAYEILSDDETRSIYDRYGHQGLQGRGGFHSAEDIFSSFSDLFGGFGFGGSKRSRGPEPGADLRYHLQLTFDEAVFGCTKILEIPRHKNCTTCNGRGAEDASGIQTCTRCSGSGRVHHQQGFFAVTTPCPSCGGEGKRITKPCPTCKGRQQVVEQKSVSVDIPPGVDTGNQLRLNGEGEESPAGGPPGSLYVAINVEPHPYYKRDGSDLHMTFELSFIQAALGGKLEIPTLGGGKTEIELPKTSQYGDKITIPNEGIANIRGKGRGNLYVHLDIQTPKVNSPEDRALLEQFADRNGIDRDLIRHKA